MIQKASGKTLEVCPKQKCRLADWTSGQEMAHFQHSHAGCQAAYTSDSVKMYGQAVLYRLGIPLGSSVPELIF